MARLQLSAVECNYQVIDRQLKEQFIHWLNDMYKKLFPNITNEQLAATKNIKVQLWMYNQTTITQLGMCTLLVEHKNNKKKCRFLVVPRNGQVLLGMSDTDTLNIININIDSIGAKDARDSE